MKNLALKRRMEKMEESVNRKTDKGKISNLNNMEKKDQKKKNRILEVCGKILKDLTLVNICFWTPKTEVRV